MQIAWDRGKTETGIRIDHSGLWVDTYSLLVRGTMVTVQNGKLAVGYADTVAKAGIKTISGSEMAILWREK